MRSNGHSRVPWVERRRLDPPVRSIALMQVPASGGQRGSCSRVLRLTQGSCQTEADMAMSGTTNSSEFLLRNRKSLSFLGLRVGPETAARWARREHSASC
jgi:hypothetical protein